MGRLQNTKEYQNRTVSWVDRAFANFKRHGFVIWPEQQFIYQNLADRLSGKNIIEAGCGIGTGSALLSIKNAVLGTDVLDEHIRFARQIYPFCKFDIWDIAEKPIPGYDVLVAIEVIEHVEQYERAIQNMLASAKECYISTPNRNNPQIGQDKPINEAHVKEFTPQEFLDMAGNETEILHWRDFSVLSIDTQVTPVVYHL